MPFRLAPFKLVVDPEHGAKPQHTLHDAMRLAAISTVKFKGDNVPGGRVTQLWAFVSPRGKRVMVVLGEQDGDDGKALHVRGNDKQLLLCLVGTSTSRSALISALKPGLKPLYQEIFN